MFALQATALSPGVALSVVGLLTVIGVVLGGVGSAVAQRLSNPVGRYRQLYLGVVLPFALLSYSVFRRLGLGTVVVGGQSGMLGTLAATFAELLAGGAVGLAVYLPTIPGIRSVRDIELSIGRAFVRMARYVLALSALVTVVTAPLETSQSPVVLLAVVVVLIVAFQAAAPWVISVMRSTRVPDEATMHRVADLRQRTGLTVRDVRVLDTDKEGTANATVRGVPGYRRLFVTSTFLETFDNETATALLGVQAGRQAAQVLARTIAGVLLALVPLFVSLAGAGPLWPLVGVSVGLMTLGLWVTRRGVRAADDYAAERVGPDVVADALEQYAGVHNMEPSRRRVPNPFARSPPLGNRIDRLRERAGA